MSYRCNWPYGYATIMLSKVMALLHDPPYKPFIVTGMFSREQLADITHIAPCTVASLAEKVHKKLVASRRVYYSIRVHELAAAYYMLKALYRLGVREGACTYDVFDLHKCGYRMMHFDRDSRGGYKLEGLVSLADGLASSFDRYSGGLADRVYNAVGHGSLSSAVVSSLFNMFNPRLVGLERAARRRLKNIIEESHRTLLDIIAYCAELSFGALCCRYIGKDDESIAQIDTPTFR